MKKKLLTVLLCGGFMFGLTGCSGEEEGFDDKPQDEVKGNCAVTECMKQINTSNTVEEITNIIGVEVEESGKEYTWRLDSKNYIKLKLQTGNPILQATIDKDTIKNDNINLLKASELQEMLNNGSFTYQELVEKLGGVEGILDSKTTNSVGYIWVNKSKITLSATFNNKTGKCTIASIR